MKKINNVSVGIDFSENSVNAYRYAKAFAKSVKATLTLVHVKENSFVAFESSTPAFAQTNNADLIKDLEKLIAEENENTEIKEVKIKILEGNPVEVLSELPENTGTDILILGTTGSSKSAVKFLGSTSLKISGRAHCPVMLIPIKATWQAIDQILFASNYDSLTSVFVNKIIEFTRNLHTVVHFVNVRNYDPILEPTQKDIDWSDLLQGSSPNFAFKKATIYGNDTVVELKNYCDLNKIQLMAFASKSRGFWSTLVHKSTTTEMALSTTIPLMVMHLDDEV